MELGNPSPEYFRKARKAANILRHVFHCQSCDGLCGKPQCATTSGLLMHIRGCRLAACTVPGCSTTRKLLVHYKTCRQDRSEGDSKSNFCLICTLATASYTKDSASLQRLSAALSTSPDSTAMLCDQSPISRQVGVGGIASAHSTKMSSAKYYDDTEATHPVSPPQTKRRCVSDSHVDDVGAEDDILYSSFERKPLNVAKSSDISAPKHSLGNENSNHSNSVSGLQSCLKGGSHSSSSLCTLGFKMKPMQRSLIEKEIGSSFDSVELQESYRWKVSKGPIVREEGMKTYRVSWSSDVLDDHSTDRSARLDDSVVTEAAEGSEEYTI